MFPPPFGGGNDREVLDYKEASILPRRLAGEMIRSSIFPALRGGEKL